MSLSHVKLISLAPRLAKLS